MQYIIAVKALMLVTVEAASPAVAERKVQESLGNIQNRRCQPLPLYVSSGNYEPLIGATIAPVLDVRGRPTIEGFLDMQPDSEDRRKIRGSG